MGGGWGKEWVQYLRERVDRWKVGEGMGVIFEGGGVGGGRGDGMGVNV